MKLRLVEFGIFWVSAAFCWLLSGFVVWPAVIVGWQSALLLGTFLEWRKERKVEKHFEEIKASAFQAMRDSSVLGDCALCHAENVSTIELQHQEDIDRMMRVCIACLTGKNNRPGMPRVEFQGAMLMPPQITPDDDQK